MHRLRSIWRSGADSETASAALIVSGFKGDRDDYEGLKSWYFDLYLKERLVKEIGDRDMGTRDRTEYAGRVMEKEVRMSDNRTSAHTSFGRASQYDHARPRRISTNFFLLATLANE